MSTENERNENELNEQELWDLLKEPVETEIPAKKEKKSRARKEEKAENTGDSKPKAVITEKRKRALVWYLVGLFGIAFIIVLISLFFRGQSTDPSSTDPAENPAQVQELYERINELEAENEALIEEVMEQQEQLEYLNLMINDMTYSLEYGENNQYYGEDSERYQRTVEAYKTLVRAQNAFINYNEEVLEEAMNDLSTMLDLLSEEGRNAYYMVIEYMEQPYLGQE